MPEAADQRTGTRENQVTYQVQRETEVVLQAFRIKTTNEIGDNQTIKGETLRSGEIKTMGMTGNLIRINTRITIGTNRDHPTMGENKYATTS